jgi:adenosylhomocysteine nucleosidase
LLAFVAAEAREFSGFLRHAERVVKLDWPLDFARLDFARKVWLNGRAALLVANGPGPKLAGQAVEIARGREELNGLVSTGFCGALDPTLKVGDIFVPVAQAFLPVCDFKAPNRPYKTGKLLSVDHVAITAAEKSELHKSGADVIEMEAAAVAAKAQEYNLPFYCIRVVTDTAEESLPLDFNRMRDAEGRFSRSKIVAAALRKPMVFPELLKFNKRCKDAAQALGDFIADTRF